MRHSISFLLVAGLLALPAHAQDINAPTLVKSDGTLLWDACGGEGERACLPGNAGYPYLVYVVGIPKCDITLDPVFESGVWMCRDKGRRRAVPEIPYTGIFHPVSKQVFQNQADQFTRISADLPMNYIPILGTHDSYANFKDGGNNKTNVNQQLTITDQLQMGARYIRLDPISKVQNGTPILCHMSPYFKPGLWLIDLPGTEQEACNFIVPAMAGPFKGHLSFQRPFFYAVRELRHWLERHPDEVIVLRINYSTASSALGHTISASDISAVLEHELGSRLWRNAATTQVPTPRQMRAAGAQVLVLSGRTGRPYHFRDPSPFPGNASSLPLFPGCFDVRLRPTGLNRPFTTSSVAHWVNIGENRSLSNLFEEDSQKGLLGALETELAVYCGYSIIALDFFHALPWAPKETVPKVDYTGPLVDPRPQASIWSWQPGTSLDVAMPAALTKPVVNLPMFPASLTDYRTYRWKPLPDTSALPYACAGSPLADNPRKYEWRITSATGPWANGEAECQKLGADFHFWRPMSSIENQQLVGVFKTQPGQNVWLNHYPGQTRALPSAVEFDYNDPADAGRVMKTIIMTSGMGGKLFATFEGPNGIGFLEGLPSLNDTGRIAPNWTGSPRIDLRVSAAAAAKLAPGTHTGTLLIQEMFGDSMQSAQVAVTMRLSRPASSLVASPSGPITFTAGLQRQIAITSDNQPATLLQPAGLPAWLSASLDKTTTPAVLTVSADPSKVTGTQTHDLQIASSTSGVAAVTIPLTISVVQVSLSTAPVAIPINVDGANISVPATRTWVVGSSHYLVAAASHGASGSAYSFKDWADGVSTAARTVIAGTSTSSFSVNYDVRHALTLTQPGAGGSIAAQNASFDGMYPHGSTVTLTAIPASGFAFQRFTGASTATQAPTVLTMNAPKSVSAVFVQEQGKTTITSSPVGRTVLVDGASYTTPASFVWPPGESHAVSAPAQNGAPGVRYAFASWADAVGTSTRMVAGSVNGATLTANFSTQYEVTAGVSPAQSGTLTGGGWYSAGATASLSAAPAAGFQFASFTGVTGNGGSTVQLTVNAPATVIANFTATVAPVLVASSSGRTDIGNNMVRVPLVLMNAGRGPAGDAVITGIDTVATMQGSGAVSVQFPQGGVPVGTILPGQRAQTAVDFNWPTSATRVSFTVRYSANGGAYQGSNAITIFR